MTGYAIDHPGGRRRARHEFLMMHGRRRRGHRGFGPPGFERQFFGGGRKAGRGDIRATILALLAEEPMHGYQIIQEVSERTGGAWRPSPGSVYPTLQQLEDEELVRTRAQQRPAGLRAHRHRAASRRPRFPAPTPWEAAGEGDDDLAALRDLAFQLLGATRQVAVAGTAKQIEAAQAILRNARKGMYQLLAEDGDGEADAAEGVELRPWPVRDRHGDGSDDDGGREQGAWAQALARDRPSERARRRPGSRTRMSPLAWARRGGAATCTPRTSRPCP